MQLKTLLSFSAVIIGLSGAIAAPVSANYIFSGSGTSGNFTGQAGEPWIFNFEPPFDNWGSPGVGASITPYLEADSAFGLDLTFFDVNPIDVASIALGNVSACAGTGSGGTTFCSTPFDATGFWQAFLTGPSSISFRAQNVSQVLDQGENFFVNVFFNGEADGRTISFNGEWITEFSPNPAPLPGILPLIATGLGLLQLSRWQNKRKANR